MVKNGGDVYAPVLTIWKVPPEDAPKVRLNVAGNVVPEVGLGSPHWAVMRLRSYMSPSGHAHSVLMLMRPYW